MKQIWSLKFNQQSIKGQKCDTAFELMNTHVQNLYERGWIFKRKNIKLGRVLLFQYITSDPEIIWLIEWFCWKISLDFLKYYNLLNPLSASTWNKGYSFSTVIFRRIVKFIKWIIPSKLEFLYKSMLPRIIFIIAEPTARYLFVFACYWKIKPV